VFAGQNVGIKEVSEKIWLVSFMHYDLGFFDEECGRVECAQNPFDAKAFAGSMEWTKIISVVAGAHFALHRPP
jgi:hypothetical protein